MVDLCTRDVVILARYINERQTKMGHHHDKDYNKEHRESYEAVKNAPHEAHLSHELIAGAAAYEAAKAYNDHKAKTGEEVSHAKAKEIFAGAAGALLTRLVETKGMDYFDKKKAEQDAKKMASDHYGYKDEC